MTVNSVLFNGNTEHLAGRGTIDIFAFRKYFGTPGFTGKEGQNASFDGREVRYDELVSVSCNEGGTDQLAECIWDVIIKKLHSIVIAASDDGSGFSQVIHVILRKVLQLDQSACPSARAVGSIELEHTPVITFVGIVTLFAMIFSSLLDKEVYQSRRADLTRKADRLDAEIAELEAKYHEAEVIQDDGVQSALETLNKFSDATELNQEIVGALIEKVLVYDPRHVEIRWKFSDEVLKLLQG